LRFVFLAVPIQVVSDKQKTLQGILRASRAVDSRPEPSTQYTD
jgi:hypothetical protein